MRSSGGGSIFPATWSAMLAARADGVGSSLTSVFFFQIDEVLEILGVPKDEGWLFSSCVTFGYPTAASIQNLLQTTPLAAGFTVAGGGWSVTSAVTPGNCSLTYTVSAGPGSPPTVVINSINGC